jgi:phenylacetate-CoA ligase
MKPPQMATAAFQDFLTTPLQTRLARHLSTSPQDRVVELFRGAARDVPAYREFLTSQGIDSADVKTYADFQTLPLTTKQNYMLAYPLPTLTRDGRLAECEMVAVSSGSTGRPLFWPRSLDPFTTRSAPVFSGAPTCRPRSLRGRAFSTIAAKRIRFDC